MKGWVVVVFVLICGCFPWRASAQVYRLIELPMQVAVDINDSGAVIGHDVGVQSFLWRDGATISLGPMGAEAINNRGKVVGSALVSSETLHAFLWEDGVMTDLGTLGGLKAIATSINDSGEVTGWSNPTEAMQGPHAFVWRNGVLTDLGTLGGESSNAFGINDSGQVVGVSRLDDTTDHAFLWQDGSMSDLGTLPGAYFSQARAVNNAGVAVGTSTLVGNSGFVAVRWSGGGISNLGLLLDSIWAVSDATNINDAGEIVGRATAGGTAFSPRTVAFLWKNGVMTDLNSVTDTSGGWDLGVAVAINNQGDIICNAFRHGLYQQAALLKRGDLLLTHPGSGDFFISGEKDTVRWKSGLAPGEQVVLHRSLDDGQTWALVESGILADSEYYVWTVPDTISSRARIMISSLNDLAKNDTSGLFTIRPYILSKPGGVGQSVAYDPSLDQWAVGNYPEEIWPAAWYERFDYSGVDSLTGKGYLAGGLTSSYYFLTASRSDFPDWPSFVRTFTTAACYIDLTRPVYSPTAVAKWASIKGDWNGSCFGFATSNAIVFRNKDNFANDYPEYPSFNYPREVSTDFRVNPVINELFTHQFGNPHAGYELSVGIGKTPTQTLSELKEMFLADDAPVRTLAFYNNTSTGGHAVVPYKLSRDPDQRNLWYLNVYDNNNPTGLDVQITIDTAQNSGNGSWDLPSYSGWGGPKWLFLMDIALGYLAPPLLPKTDPRASASPLFPPAGTIELIPNRTASIRIQDARGGEAGYFDSLVHANIPGSHPKFILNGYPTPPYGYRVPDSLYSITMNNFSDSLARLFLFKLGKTLAVERGGADSGQTDRFTYDGGLTVANPDTAVKTFRLTNIIHQVNPHREKVFSFASVSLSENDSVAMENVGVDGLKFISLDTTPKTYTLEVERDSAAEIRQFTHDSVQLDGNSSHIIQPDWSSLAPDAALQVLIDHGNDGIIDDSLLLANELTGIDDERSGGIPSDFALHQNYPNPFNPLTTIGYDLPRATHVTIRIHDVFGREVATLVDGMQSAGFQSVEWNAANVTSGVYFYALQTGEFTMTKKLIVLR